MNNLSNITTKELEEARNRLTKEFEDLRKTTLEYLDKLEKKTYELDNVVKELQTRNAKDKQNNSQ